MKKLLLATFAVVRWQRARPVRPICRFSRRLRRPPPCAQFGGFYVGGNVGWGYGEHKFRDLDGFANHP